MKKYIFTLVIIFIFVFSPKVFAKEYLGGTDFSWAWNGWSTVGYYQDPAGQTVPKSFSLSSKTYSSNWVLSMYAFNNSMGYLYIDTCSNLGQYVASAIITNSSYGTSYFESGSYRAFVDLGACQMGNTNLTHHLVFEIPITKMYYSDNTYTVDSYLKFYNDATYGTTFQINYAYASDTKLSTSQDMMNKLNSINTSITNMQNNIINNQNSNTQNIINNQNQNQAQNHQDSINTQNKIDDLNDSVTDDNVNSNTGKSFFDNFSDNTHGLSGIITAPLNIIQQIINVNPTNCQPLSTTYHNKTISLPCGAIFWGHTGFSQFNDFYNMVVGGLFCYLIVKDLFLTIEGMKDPDNDKVEVMDL